MPFESKKQQRYMFSQHPRIAKRWADYTPDIKTLPEEKMGKTASEIAELLLKRATDGKGNPFNTLTTTRPSKDSTMDPPSFESTVSSLPETKPISDGTEDGAFGGVTKVSLAQKIAEYLLEQATYGHTE